jgi:pilus assembly protein CpaB
MRRAIGIIGAVAVAALGTLLLVGYVRGAESRALAGEELVEVLVVDRAIAQGVPASLLGNSVRLERVPLKVAAEGSVADLATLEDLVAATDLLPGEQIVASRFVVAESLVSTARIEAPDDFLEVTVAVSPERALGGQLVPGDVVAVIASFDPFDLNTFEPSDLGPGEVIDPSEIFLGTTGENGEEGQSVQSPNSTGLILHDVLVTAVQVEQLPRAAAEDLPDDAPALAPTGNLLITLAGPADAIQRIVFTAEHGFLWLAAEGPDAPDTFGDIITRATVYKQ